MIGSEFYQAASVMYSNFGIDTILFYQLLNEARTARELERPFRRLTKVSNTQQVTQASTWQTAYNLPTDFEYLTEDGLMTLFDGQNTYQEMDEIPFNLIPQFKDYSYKFAIDHGSQKYYILGIVDKSYNNWIYYQADWGDITATTTWVNIPSRFHMLLVYDLLNRYELGVDYDDIQVRNATKLGQMAENLFNAMCKWDDRLQRSATTRMDYGQDPADIFIANKISIGTGNFMR